MSEDPWKIHGYFFAICFGIFMVSLVWLVGDVMDIPKGVPLNEVLSPAQGFVFVGLLGACAALAYLLARIASLALHALIRALRQR